MELNNQPKTNLFPLIFQESNLPSWNKRRAVLIHLYEIVHAKHQQRPVQTRMHWKELRRKDVCKQKRKRSVLKQIVFFLLKRLKKMLKLQRKQKNWPNWQISNKLLTLISIWNRQGFNNSLVSQWLHLCLQCKVEW